MKRLAVTIAVVVAVGLIVVLVLRTRSRFGAFKARDEAMKRATE